MGKIITVSNNKGGAGKTTIATNLSVNLAKKGFKTLLMDIDGQCGCSISFGYSPKKFIDKSILSFIKDIENNNLKDLVITNFIKNFGDDNVNSKLMFLPSEPDMSCIDHFLNDDINIKNNYLWLLDFIKEKFDFIVIDTPPNLSSMNVFSFLKSDLIIVPFEAERQNIEGVITTIEEVNKLEYDNDILPKILLLPNKIKERGLVDKLLLAYINDVIALDKKAYNSIFSEINISNTIQFKYVNTKECKPLIISKSKSKAIILQKQFIDQLTNQIIQVLNIKK